MRTVSPAGGNGGKGANQPQTDTRIKAAGQADYVYKWHWHVLLVHFPTASFIGSFAFMVMHLITQTSCFELSAYVTLFAGAAVMIPTTVSGWITWKKKYQGVKGKIFLSKIRISFAMIAISIALVIYRSIFIIEHLNILSNLRHFLYFLGATLLFLGAVAEGYYGGRLNHR